MPPSARDEASPRSSAHDETSSLRSTSNDEALLRLCDAGSAWIVTVTQRLAFTLRSRVAELRAARGVPVAETPAIRSIDDWLATLGRETLAREAAAGGASRVLLSPAAEQLLWERVIVSSPGDLPAELLDTAALAATASDAWKRICLWGEPSWSGPLVEDVERFFEWLPRFRARLEAGRFVTRAELPALLAQAMDGGALDGRLPRVAVLLGFEKEDPSATTLASALERRGVEIRDRLDAPEPEPARPRIWSAADPAGELRSVAANIRERLLAEPDLRIGVVAPQIAAYGARLERVFEEELDPAGVLDLDREPVRRFDLADAPALADYPLVATAFDLLSLTERRVRFETASRLLLADHPREGGDAESFRLRRGEVEARLRRDRSAVLQLAGSEGSLATVLRTSGLPVLAERLETLARRIDEAAGERRSPSRWRREWIDRLKILGWPGALAGDTEGLVFRRWRDALDEFAMLEAVEPSLREHEALARLRGICFAMRVQPPASSRSVQVMNLLDAAGLEFDVVFAIGLTATAFPAAPSPNPLLPVAWQRSRRGMPRVSVEGERELAERIWSRLRRSAREIYASWPVLGEQEEENSPSVFVATSELGDAAPPPADPWWLAAAQASPEREARPDDDTGAPLVRRGGSSVLQYQSDCSFRAFAAVRLAAGRLDAIQPQPDASKRGNLVHSALAAAYAAIPSSGDLAGLDDANIDDVARDAARHAIAEHAALFADAADLASAAQHWLKDLVAAWMRYEKQARDDAWEVVSAEIDDEAAFPPSADAPLQIAFRPDRIDRSGDGLVILDWKTSGSPKRTALWRGERPEDVQLPLYLALLASRAEVSGIAFANLSARDDCELQGVAATTKARGWKPPKNGYEAQKAEWSASLERLALDYLAGAVRTDPRSVDVCRRCGGQPLCRIRESGAVEEDEALEGEGAA